MTDLDLGLLHRTLADVAVPADSASMAAYMKNHFDFLGVKAPARRAASKSFLAASRRAPIADAVAVVRACWERPEREIQYVGCDVLARNRTRLDAHHLDDLESLIASKSWWDTVDSLASPTVGELVRTNPTLVSVMDDWITRDDIWLARTAIIHQLRFGAETDAERLFAYCLQRGDDSEFFIRKAIGWALRQYARNDPAAVSAFVEVHAVELSSLSRREALRHL